MSATGRRVGELTTGRGSAHGTWLRSDFVMIARTALGRLRARLVELRGRPALMKAGNNAAWLIGERLGRILVGLLVTLWVARYLGPDQYGQLSFAMASAALMGAFAGLGLDQIVVRDIARNPARSS